MDTTPTEVLTTETLDTIICIWEDTIQDHTLVGDIITEVKTGVVDFCYKFYHQKKKPLGICEVQNPVFQKLY